MTNLNNIPLLVNQIILAAQQEDDESMIRHFGALHDVLYVNRDALPSLSANIPLGALYVLALEYYARIRSQRTLNEDYIEQLVIVGYLVCSYRMLASAALSDRQKEAQNRAYILMVFEEIGHHLVWCFKNKDNDGLSLMTPMGSRSRWHELHTLVYADLRHMGELLLHPGLSEFKGMFDELDSKRINGYFNAKAGQTTVISAEELQSNGALESLSFTQFLKTYEG